MNSRPELKLDWCTHEAAKYACEKWHYSGTMPVGKTVKIGVWENHIFIGAVVFAYGANNNLLKPFGLKQVQGCELVRVALSKHFAAVSRILRIALALLKRSQAGLRLVVSFADTREGHHGGIYQAGGWFYAGECKPPTEYRWNGRWVHSMQIQTFIRSGKCGSRKNLEKREGSGKHRYLMPLDEAMRKQIEPLRRPYPKRAGSAGSGTSNSQLERGGANPTPALSVTREEQ